MWAAEITGYKKRRQGHSGQLMREDQTHKHKVLLMGYILRNYILRGRIL